ncbi:hypothetical protein OAR74_00025 [Gammaproteobacteria bacterium]|nr:hypothetical protein [Gammaproteobacteria bacterium]
MSSNYNFVKRSFISVPISSSRNDIAIVASTKPFLLPQSNFSPSYTHALTFSSSISNLMASVN